MPRPKNRAILDAGQIHTAAEKLHRDAVHAVPALVTVRVVRQAIGEAGVHYPQGSTFQTTPARAKALGALVEIV